MRSLLKCGIFIITLFVANISSPKVYASHCAGAELLYQWLHDSTYQLYYKFYRDCAGIDAASSVNLCYSNTCNSSVYSVTMNKVTALIPPGVANGSEITINLCPGYQTTCTNSASTIPGYREWWYTATVTLPSRCNYWTFAVYQNARNAAITNLANPGSQTLYTEATLDNLDAQGDTSPFFSVKPVPFVCVNIPDNFNCGAYDVNNDSMVFTMIQPMTNTGSCTGGGAIAWAAASPAYNLTDNPLQTNNTFSLNNTNGQMTFTPSGTQIAAIAIRVDEYRNQIKIGSVMRDAQVIVQSCSGMPSPPVTGNPFAVNGGIFSTSPDNNIVCYGGISMSFKIQSSILPATNSITMISDNATTALGSTFTVPPYYNMGNDTGVFSWIPGVHDSGDHLITFTTLDSCNGSSPFLVSSTYQLRIHVIGSSDSNLCNSFAVGGNLDSSDVGRFIIGTDTFGSVYSHLANPAAVNSYTLHPDTIQLFIDSTYNVQEAGIMNTIHDADAKVTLFMDFNANGQYDIPDERVWTTFSKAFLYYIVDTTLTIPNTAVTDVPVMMRLILNNDTGASAASDSACGPYISGETEDFTVIFRNATSSVKQHSDDKSIAFSPNPSAGEFTIRLKSNTPVKFLQLTIMSVTGQKIDSRVYHDLNTQFSAGIDLSTVPKGLYFVETDADGEKQISKIVLQ